MRPIRLNGLSPEQLGELDELYHRTRDVRVRTRAQMILLAAERGLAAAEVATVVRQDEETVRRWFARYLAEGIEGLSDAPRSGAPPKATLAYRERLLGVARHRPRALGLPFSPWTAARLADHLAELTGVRLSAPSVCRLLRADGMRLRRPQHTITSPDPEYALKKGRSRRPAIAWARAESSTTPTSSTSAGTRRSEPCGAPSGGR
jgi:transposase